MTDAEGRRLGMPLELAKKNLRDDPQTHEIARALGVEVEVYIDRVIHYALHPEKPPEVELLDDESVAQLGPEAPTVARVTAWFEQVASGEVRLEDRVEVAAEDGFSTEALPSERHLDKTAGEKSLRRAPRVDEGPRAGDAPSASGAGAVLRQQLLEQQRSLRLGMDARRAGQGPKPGGKRS